MIGVFLGVLYFLGRTDWRPGHIIKAWVWRLVLAWENEVQFTKKTCVRFFNVDCNLTFLQSVHLIIHSIAWNVVRAKVFFSCRSLSIASTRNQAIPCSDSLRLTVTLINSRTSIMPYVRLSINVCCNTRFLYHCTQLHHPTR